MLLIFIFPQESKTCYFFFVVWRFIHIFIFNLCYKEGCKSSNLDTMDRHDKQREGSLSPFLNDKHQSRIGSLHCVRLKSSDGIIFEVDRDVAFQSQILEFMVTDTLVDQVFPLANVSSEILTKVIEFCEYHVTNKNESENKVGASNHSSKEWDANFMNVNESILLELMKAADYLNIPKLLELSTLIASTMVERKTIEEIIELYGQQKKKITTKKN